MTNDKNMDELFEKHFSEQEMENNELELKTKQTLKEEILAFAQTYHIQKLQEVGEELPNEEEIITDAGRRFDIGDRYHGYKTGSVIMRQLALPVIAKLKEESVYSEKQRNLCADQCDIYRKLALKTCNERDELKQENEKLKENTNRLEEKVEFYAQEVYKLQHPNS